MVIESTKGFIAFERNPEAGHIYDFDVWLVNVYTKEEIRLTKSLKYWEYAPVWLSDSELVYLIEPQEKTMTETDLVYTNFRKGRSKLLDFWNWQNCPRAFKVSVDSLRNIYYGHWDDIYILTQNGNKYQLTPLFPVRRPNQFKPEQFGLKEIKNPVIAFDGSKLLFVGCDTAKYRRLQEIKKFYDDIYLYDLKEKSLKRLTIGDFTYEDPVWVNSDTIIFTSNCDGNYELYLMELKSKKVIRLTTTPDITETQPDVSPDGKKIAYSRYDKKTDRSEIWIMDIRTKETYFLTEGRNPDWSPAQ